MPARTRSQPATRAVLVVAAELSAARASAAALSANRAGRFDEAAAILQAAAVNLRAMANGIAEIIAIAEELEREQPIHAALMAPMAMKIATLRLLQPFARSRQGRQSAPFGHREDVVIAAWTVRPRSGGFK